MSKLNLLLLSDFNRAGRCWKLNVGRGACDVVRRQHSGFHPEGLSMARHPCVALIKSLKIKDTRKKIRKWWISVRERHYVGISGHKTFQKHSYHDNHNEICCHLFCISSHKLTPKMEPLEPVMGSTKVVPRKQLASANLSWWRESTKCLR